MAGELTPTIAALIGRYDQLRDACARGRKVVEERRKEMDACEQHALESETDLKEAEAKAQLEATRMEPLPGMKRPLALEIKADAVLATMTERRKADTMKALAKSAESAWRDAGRQLRSLEKEFETIQSIAHAYNRELKTFDG
jgi:hypothetical protein